MKKIKLTKLENIKDMDKCMEGDVLMIGYDKKIVPAIYILNGGNKGLDYFVTKGDKGNDVKMLICKREGLNESYVQVKPIEIETIKSGFTFKHGVNLRWAYFYNLITRIPRDCKTGVKE